MPLRLGIWYCSPWCSTGFSRATISRTIEMYSRVRASGFGYGCPYHPSTTCGPDAPRPRMKRPPERWSMVMAAIAVAAGARAESCMMEVPSFTLVVCDPHHASGDSASDP